MLERARVRETGGGATQGQPEGERTGRAQGCPQGGQAGQAQAHDKQAPQGRAEGERTGRAQPAGERGPHARRHARRRRSRARKPLWARVYLAVHLVLVLVPIAIVATWSVSAAWPWPSLAPASLTDRGFEAVLADSSTGLGSLWLSIGIAVAVAVLTTAVATLAARAVCLHEWRGRRVFEFATMLPFLIPSTVFAMGVQVAFIRLGLARSVGGVILAHCIVALPYAMGIMCDVTRASGRRMEEAALTCGAGRLSTIVHATLPGLAPGFASSLLMCYIMSFSQYFLTLLIGGGAVRTFALVLFPYLGGGDRTVAGAYGAVFIAVTLLVFLVFELLLRKLRSVDEASYYES